ncbi:carbohydrate ABC transporter permease [Rugosimonospora africana]|uniref:Sugar ABC transporter permease n=1 Tax=Rugosimonospora africana TaxID=556532 RepID=A0A8J3R2P4_9ACTN|nr:carbohydrate ABC transporter permease [Rugosimonospora africana]GIH20782.1 sugar ABC transporter permease [Rugosimonospora africana]
MSVTVTPRVPTLVPAGTAVTVPPRRSLIARVADRFGKALLQICVWTVGLFWLLPTVGLFIESLRAPADNSATGWWTVFGRPARLTLSNYLNLMQDKDILGSLWNSVLITVPSTVLVVGIGALAAYALAWIDFPGRNWVYALTVALIVVPVQVAIIPDAAVFRTLHIYGDVPAVVAFHVAFGLPFAIFLLRDFFAGIPRDLLEAARVDGGSELGIFRRVVLPIGRPAIAALAVYEFMWVWNDLLVALVFADSAHAPITYQLLSQMRTFSSNIDLIGPGAFVSMLVPLVVFFSFRRYFLHGMLAGSDK